MSARVLNPHQANHLLRFIYDNGSDYEHEIRLTEALAALVPESDLLHTDHRLFQIIHLITEYSWTAIHHTLCDLVSALSTNDLAHASRLADRCSRLAELPVVAVRLMHDTLSQFSFLTMRSQFRPGDSGLDSPGARGLRKASRAAWNAFEATLEQLGLNLDDLFKAADAQSSADMQTGMVSSIMSGLYRFDSKVLEWKQVHMNMVWMLLGGRIIEKDTQEERPLSQRGRPISDLERLAARPLFPLLWEHSTSVYHRFSALAG